jgi:hypothetical protein
VARLVFFLVFTSAVPADDKAVNLVQNGGFETTDAADTNKPAFWDRPDGLGVQWLVEEGGKGHGKAIRMNTAISEADMVQQWRKVGIDKWDIPKPTKAEVAGSYGLSFYSDSTPVVSGQAYRVSFNFKGAGGGGKVWVRGYGLLKGKERRLYETIVNCNRGGKGWTSYSRTFHPTTNTPHVVSMKVMLYAYWPPGVYWFDDLAITPVSNEVWKAEMVDEEK